MLTPRFALRLLAPTVLVSLILVAACTFGALYLDHLRVNAAEVLAENQESTHAASELLSTPQKLLSDLRGPQEPELVTQVWKHDRRIHAQLVKAQELANYEGERQFVQQIAAGLEIFDAALARDLPPDTPLDSSG